MLILSRPQAAIVRLYQRRYGARSLRAALSSLLLEADAEMAAEERCEQQYAREEQSRLPAGAGVPVYRRMPRGIL